MKNKWIKLVILFLVALDSYAIPNLLFHSLNDLPRLFINYTFMLLCVILVNIFVFKDKSLLKKFGVMKQGFFDSILMAFIFLMAVLLFNFVIFCTSQNNLFFYYSDFVKYISDFGISFSTSIPFFFLLGILIQVYAAFIEESIFRGNIINTLAPRDGILNTSIAVVISALLFSMWHLDFSINGFFSKFVLGLVFGACFTASKNNITGSGILHSLSNLWAPANLAYLFMLIFR
jgi:membrane protease YdiL (CAAX protease family)